MSQSWHLSDAREVANAHKYTFYKPSSAIIDKLEAGNRCRLIFRFDSDNPEHPSAERMWVTIEKIEGDVFTGSLSNQPVYIKDLQVGDAVCFKSEHIIDLDVDDDEPNLVEKYIDRCFATRRIIYEKATIGYLYRDEPMEGERQGFKDSGWRFLEGDEDQASLDKPDNAQFVSLGLILNNDDSFIDLLESSIGSAYLRDKETGRFIKIDS